MIRAFLFLFILLNSIFVWAEATVNQQEIIDKIEQLNTFNESLAILNDDDEINAVLERKNKYLTDFMKYLHASSVQELPPIVSKEHLNLLITRININKEKSNQLAMQRDQLKQKWYQSQKNTREFLIYLVQAMADYQPASKIVHYSKNKLSRSLKNHKKIQLPTAQDSLIYKDLEKNYHDFRIANDTYQDLLRYCINNAEKISVTHWTKYISLTSITAYINHFEFLRPVNRRLSAFKIDIGGILLSFVILMFVYL
ncbi:MAG: hypothetical protein KAG10_02215, partial [Methylococcales bacterium]|nr:hypothetical protein [Methylococcales bacterium]